MGRNLQPITEKELAEANLKYNSRPQCKCTYTPTPTFYNRGYNFYEFKGTLVDDDMSGSVFFLSGKPAYELRATAKQLLEQEKPYLRDGEFTISIEEKHPYKIDMSRLIIDKDINLGEFM